MVTLDSRPLYPTRICDTLGYALTQGEESEQRLYDETTDYLRFIYNKAKVLNQSAARLAMSVFQRRLASSTYALLRSFERRIGKLDAIIDDVQSGNLSIEQLLSLQRGIREEDDAFESKSADEESMEGGIEENERSEEQLLQGVIAESLAELVAEREQVVALRNLARHVHEAGTESKFEKLREVITDSRFLAEKLLLFTEHRDTLEFLVRRLDALGYTGQTVQIHGGMHYTERQEQIERFRKPLAEGGARFMICTDAAAEGVNLQFCWIMINYDVPWNPARLEQRMGRIHRYGQKHDPVVILNLVAPSTREGRVLKTLLDKLEKIRKQLKSDKVFDSIGRIFSDISLKHYMERALTDDLEQIALDLDGRLTKEQVKALEERERRMYGDGGDVKRELPRLRENMDREAFFRLLPGYVRNYVVSAAPLLDIVIEGDSDGAFALHATRKAHLAPLVQALEAYPPELADRLTVYRPDDRQSAIWMHPGEQVFECFRGLVRESLKQHALQGAVFVDAETDRPYLFHLARLTVKRQGDPEVEALAQEEVVESRLVGVRQYDGAEISLCPIEHLLILRNGHGLTQEAQRLALSAPRLCEQAKAYLTERVCRTMAMEHRARMLESLPERETFIQRGYSFHETELASARAKLSQKARAGDKSATMELTRIKTQQRELGNRRESALAVIRREPELLAPGDVEFLAHALVQPPSEQTAAEDAQQQLITIERVAMDLARAYEEAAGAKVRFVHTPQLARAAGLPDNPGFDILSLGLDGERRCIEVKGRAALGEILVTDNEWARACNLQDEYWFYVVYHCATPTPRMVRVQNPFDKLLVRPFTRTQRVERTIKGTVESSGVRIGYNQIMEVGEA